jgi:hypothetical protein
MLAYRNEHQPRIMMSGFLFNRRATSPVREPEAPPAPTVQSAPAIDRGLVQAQAITASAIFAMLVSKGVLTAEEAADYMNEISFVLERDVEGETGAEAGNMLRSYGRALIAADG